MNLKLFALIILLLSTAIYSQLPPIEPGVSQELAKWRSARYSDICYKLDLTLEKMSPVLKGHMEIRVNVGARTLLSASPQSGEMTPIILDWRKLRGFEDHSTVSNVSLNGSTTSLSPPSGDADRSVRAPFEEISDHLIFRDGKPGENVITLDFTSPILTSGSAITRYIDKEDGSEYIYSLFVPSDASTAFPVFDQPDLKARFNLTIEFPAGWTPVSNTPLKAASESILDYFENGNLRVKETSIWHFEETKPISTYVFAFAVGPFKEFVDGFPPNVEALPREFWTEEKLAEHKKNNRVYVRRSQAAKFQPHAAETFRLTREAIKYLETYFDYKFPWPKYDLVLIPEFPFGGMEHAGATFLRESSVIFPTEPTKGDYISRANVIFHETAHQWFGDLVTMRWFDDLWLKEGFAEFMAYKTLEKVMPDANAWKVFYERNKQAAYATDSTRGTTSIYQPIANLSAAKSAYGNIVYRKAPSFLRQAEFYLGPDKFQTAVRAFLKKHQYANAGWEDLVGEFQTASWSPRNYSYWNELTSERKAEFKARDAKILADWANAWITQPGVPKIKVGLTEGMWEVSSSGNGNWMSSSGMVPALGLTLSPPFDESPWAIEIKTLYRLGAATEVQKHIVSGNPFTDILPRQLLKNGNGYPAKNAPLPDLIFPNYGDYGYGIFLLDDKSRDYVLKHIGEEKDPFLRSMMWGALWDSVREAELDPREYVELVIRQLSTEPDETTTASLLGRVSTALNYYLPADADCVSSPHVSKGSMQSRDTVNSRGSMQPSSRVEPLLTCGLRTRLETILLDRMQHAATPGQRITFYRAFVSNAATAHGREVLKQMLKSEPGAVATGFPGRAAKNPVATAPGSDFHLRTKDKFDIVTRLIVLGDPDAPKLLADLERTETSDDAKRYAYAAQAAFPTAENRAKFWNDFVNNKDISESWIEASIGPFNSIRHPELSQPYLARALGELPDLKRTRKIFFVNNWLGAWLSGQRDEKALAIVNKFLADNPNLDNDLRLKVLENVDVIERAVKIRKKFSHE